MAVRAYATEDGNLSSSIVVSRQKKFQDVDLDFANIESTAGVRTDLVRKVDVEAVKQSVKNILLTVPGEKPFMPIFGSQLNFLLFELDTDMDMDVIEEEIENSLSTFEPRALVQRVLVDIDGDTNNAQVTVEFQVINSGERAVVTVDVARIR